MAVISATRPAKKLRLRRPDHCRVCSVELPIGTAAIWDPAARTVTCISCTQGTDGPPPPPADPGPAGADLPRVDPGRPGASALREYQRRHDAREQHARDALGGLGVFLSKVIDEPASTRVWQQGAKGEVRVGERLEKLLTGSGVLLLHDRRVPGHGKANIDHLAVGPGGVTVIDAKTHHGKIRRDWQGGLFTDRRTILRINGRDQTKLIAGIQKQVGYIRAALTKLDPDLAIEVTGALCFPNPDGLPFFRRIEIGGILVDGPKPVSRCAARPGPHDAGAVKRVWTYLAHAFPSA